MHILITSPRAPAVLEWGRIALRSGHDVTLCDSLRFPIGRFLRSNNLRYYQITGPRHDIEAYQKAITPLIAKADYVIPTCEDIFYLARLPLSHAERSKCLMPGTELLLQLHHKINVFSALPECKDIAFPNSKLIKQHADIVDDKVSGEKTVLKPIYSRFGREVVRGVSTIKTQDLTISPVRPWVQQRFIGGDPLCNFAVCQHGKLIAHAMYRPRYLLNGSASTYFEAIQDSRIENFMQAFVRKNNYHGQVAFDFIDEGKQLWVLECNPRVTSGLHLLGRSLEMDNSGNLTASKQYRTTSYRVGASLPLLFGVNAMKTGSFCKLIQDYRRAKNVLSDLPWYAPMLSFAEIANMSLKSRKSLSDVTTHDIEFDGY